jgi:hypothetical protein
MAWLALAAALLETTTCTLTQVRMRRSVLVFLNIWFLEYVGSGRLSKMGVTVLKVGFFSFWSRNTRFTSAGFVMNNSHAGFLLCLVFVAAAAAAAANNRAE